MTRLASLPALAGCGVADPAATSDVDAFAADGVAPMPQQFSLDITDPLVPGQPVDITISGLPPGTTPVVARSNGDLGTGPCPAPLGGSCLDITPGTSGYNLMNFFPAADAAGVSAWSGTLPSTVPTGLTFAFQAVVTQPGGPAIGSNPLLRSTGISCTPDAYEPNDTQATAALAGPFPFSADGEICNQEEDWFAIDAFAGDAIVIGGTVDLSDGDLDYYLFDSAGTQLEYGWPDNPIEYIVPADGTYFLQILEFSDPNGDGLVPYTADIDVTTAAPCLPDANEADDDTTTATLLAPGDVYTALTSCGTDDDYFAFDGLAGEMASFDLTPVAGDGSIDTTIVDSAGAVVDSGFPDVDFTIPADGTYYLYVSQVSDDVTGGGVAYDLAYDVVVPRACPVDVYEPNDDAFSGTLATLPVPTLEAGLGACSADTIDWYLVDLTAGDEITVTAFHDATHGDIDLYLFDAPQANDLTTLNANFLARAYTGSDDDDFTYTVATTGTHYLAVRLFGAGSDLVVSDGNIYDLEISVAP